MSEELLPGPRPAPNRWYVLLVLALLAVTLGAVAQASREPNTGFAEHDGMMQIRDLSAHVRFAHAVWTGTWRRGPPDGEQTSAYTARSHQRVMREWAGGDDRKALPFGYSPTMVWILGPFCILPPAWPFTFWCLACWAAASWLAHPTRAPLLVSLLFFLSPLAISSLQLGQTALLSTAAFVFLARPRPERTEGWAGACKDALVLWALTAKPPLAVTAGLALLAARRARAVALAGAFTLATTLLLSPLLGGGWVADYVHLLTHYDTERAAAPFAWSLEPTYMVNLRAILHQTCGVRDATASSVSSLLWAAAAVAVAVAGLARRVAPGGAWVWATLAFLLLSPHLNATEELHLFLVVALAWSCPGLARRRAAVAVLAVLVVWLAGSLPLPVALRPVPAFSAKLALAALLALPGQARRKPARQASARALALQPSGS